MNSNILVIRRWNQRHSLSTTCLVRWTALEAPAGVAVLLHAGLDQHVHLEEVQEPAGEGLVEGEEILHAARGVAEVEVVQTGQEQRETPHRVSEPHVVTRRGSE